MTDRIDALTVVIRDTRDDDIEPLITAIKMLKRVISVSPHVSKHETYIAREQLKMELKDKLYKIVDEL